MLVNTSDDSCFNVCVKFLEASARARVSSRGLLLALVVAAAGELHLHGTFLHRGTLEEVAEVRLLLVAVSSTEDVEVFKLLGSWGVHRVAAVAIAAVSIGMSRGEGG